MAPRNDPPRESRSGNRVERHNPHSHSRTSRFRETFKHTYHQAKSKAKRGIIRFRGTIYRASRPPSPLYNTGRIVNQHSQGGGTNRLSESGEHRTSDNTAGNREEEIVRPTNSPRPIPWDFEQSSSIDNISRVPGEQDSHRGGPTTQQRRITIPEHPVSRVDNASPSPPLPAGAANLSRSATPPPHPPSPSFLDSHSHEDGFPTSEHNSQHNEPSTSGESPQGEDPSPRSGASEHENSSHRSKSTKDSQGSRRGSSSGNNRSIPHGEPSSGGKHSNHDEPSNEGEHSNQRSASDDNRPSNNTGSRVFPPEFIEGLSNCQSRSEPAPLPLIICSRPHPVSEANSFHYCNGMIAPLYISRDGTPFVLHDPTLGCFKKNPERLYWDKLCRIKERLPSNANVFLECLHTLLQDMVDRDTKGMTLYLDIKSKRRGKIVARLLRWVLSRSDEGRDYWRQRLVILLPNIESFPIYGIPLAGYMNVLKCENLHHARRNLARNSVVHFRLESEVAISQFGQMFVTHAGDGGRDVYVGPLNTRNQMKWCIRAGVKGIITQHPVDLVDVYYDHERRQPSWKTESMQGVLSRAIPLEQPLSLPRSRALDWIREKGLKARLSFHRLYYVPFLPAAPIPPNIQEQGKNKNDRTKTLTAATTAGTPATATATGTTGTTGVAAPTAPSSNDYVVPQMLL